MGRSENAVESCKLLTTVPNAEVRGVGHHRMPALLTRAEQYARWLDPEVVEREWLEDLFAPFPDGGLECWAAGS